MDYVTTKETAEHLGCCLRTVQKLCTVLGFEKTGRDFLLTKGQVGKIRLAREANPPGRPRHKSTKKSYHSTIDNS